MPEEEDNTYLYPAASISQSAHQINADNDLFGMLVSMYTNSWNSYRVDTFNKYASGPSPERQNVIRAALSSDKGPRRQFAVEARKFLSERKAADAVEAKRLKDRPNSRSASVLAAAKKAKTSTTALGRSNLGGRSSRVQGVIDDAERLGQVGALG